MRLAEGAEGNLAPARPGYRSQIRLPLVLALTVITAAAGLWGWVLHPSSSGFEAVPQDLQILVSGTGFSATETMTQTAGGVTLEVSQLGGQGYRPLRNADAFTVIEGPTGQGAADVRAYSNAQENGVAQVNGRHIANQSWAFLVLDPGGAHPGEVYPGEVYPGGAYPGGAAYPVPAAAGAHAGHAPHGGTGGGRRWRRRDHPRAQSRRRQHR